MEKILTNEEINKSNVEKIGGKAKNLYKLSKNLNNIPPWFVITTDQYQNFIETNNLKDDITEIINKINFDDRDSISNGSKKIKRLFLEKPLPKIDHKKISSVFNKFKKENQTEYVSVRSSAVGEDQEKRSFAGQMDSFLFVNKSKSLISSIKKCWASLFSERVLTYRHLSNIELYDMKMAVIVQKMVLGEKSGVLFTVNPLNYKENESLIDSTYGLGEGIVSGELETDSFKVNKKDYSFSQELAEKKHQIVFNKEREEGTKNVAVKTDKQNEPSLSEAEIRKIVETGKKIEELYKNPQDIEWTIKSDKLYILQTRPITTIDKRKKTEGNRIIWDNSNIIESFPGITKPLTFSVARMAWSNVFRQTAESLGVPDSLIEENEQIFDNMIGLIHGRVYYDLISWYKLTSLFPGFKYNRRYQEQMMGVKESYDYKKTEKSLLSKDRILGIPHLIITLFGVLKKHLSLDKEIKSFIESFNKNYQEMQSKNLKKMEPWEIMNLYYEGKSKLLTGWKVSGINSYSAMFFYGLVKSLTVKFDIDSTASIHNDLFCGEKEMDSTKPTKQLIRITNEIKKDEKVYNFFKNNNKKKILKELKEKSNFSEYQKLIEEYLDEYGYRCMNELKLEEKTLNDDPGFLIDIIKNYLRAENLNINKISEREEQKREKAEKLVERKLRYHPLKKLVFYWALRNARKNVRYRENLRLCRTKIFGFLREIARNLGEKFSRKNIIEEAEDIFYLEIKEIFDFIKGTGTLKNLKKLVSARKKEYEKFEKETLPERFTTYGIVNHNTITSIKDEEIGEAGGKNGVLKGVSCCPGVVENKVKKILSPDDDVELNGEILITKSTDPGWVPLYPSISGLLIERGSVLSHSAIVARELGLPTIVGIKNLTKIVKDGQKIKMDAEKGVVYLKDK